MTSPHRKHELGRWRGPLWLRVLTLLCVLLLGGASTAQACHSHEDASALSKGSPTNLPADHCPLCLAMHSAMPVAHATAPLLVEHLVDLVKEAPEARGSGIWSFSLFSRPPPVAIRARDARMTDCGG